MFFPARHTENDFGNVLSAWLLHPDTINEPLFKTLTKVIITAAQDNNEMHRPIIVGPSNSHYDNFSFVTNGPFTLCDECEEMEEIGVFVCLNLECQVILCDKHSGVHTTHHLIQWDQITNQLCFTYSKIKEKMILCGHHEAWNYREFEKVYYNNKIRELNFVNITSNAYKHSKRTKLQRVETSWFGLSIIIYQLFIEFYVDHSKTNLILFLEKVNVSKKFKILLLDIIGVVFIFYKSSQRLLRTSWAKLFTVFRLEDKSDHALSKYDEDAIQECWKIVQHRSTTENKRIKTSFIKNIIDEFIFQRDQMMTDFSLSPLLTVNLNINLKLIVFIGY